MSDVKSPLTRLWRRRPRGRRSLFATGMIVVALVSTAMALLVLKPYIATFLSSGRTITAEFKRNYQLVTHETKVEMAGLPVGVVNDLDCDPTGPCRVSLKVDDEALDSLGTEPSAKIVPNTVLGGSYAVELKKGGNEGTFEGDVIPVERTSFPVELDRVLETLPKPTRESVRGVVRNTNDALTNGGKDALRGLVANAPGTLRPAKQMLDGLQGTRPGTDLPRLVTNLQATAHTLSEHSGQLGSIVTDLHKTTDVLAARSKPLAEGIGELPSALRSARSGMQDLHGTLDQLATTADSFRPAAQKLDPLLRHLNPVLKQADPLLSDLRPLLADLKPTAEELVPVVQQGTNVLDDIRGPVLDRINGPVVDTVNNTWHGTGPYKDSGRGIQADHKFYEELGYLIANFDRASMTQDAQGSLLNFQVGVGTSTIGGVPLTLPNLAEHLKNLEKGLK